MHPGHSYRPTPSIHLGCRPLRSARLQILSNTLVGSWMWKPDSTIIVPDTTIPLLADLFLKTRLVLAAELTIMLMYSTIPPTSSIPWANKEYIPTISLGPYNRVTFMAISST